MTDMTDMQFSRTAQHPTPIEIRLAINEALLADQDNPETPHVPAHVTALIREAITRACDAVGK